VASSTNERPQDDRGALRDLMGLLALPALWAGKDPRSIIDLMAGAISRIVPVRVAIAEVRLRSRGTPVALIRLGSGPWTEQFTPEWLAFAHTCRSIPLYSDRGVAVPSPVGELRVLRFFMGAGARDERIWLASQAPGFPTINNVAFMRAAVSLAVSGLQTAYSEAERNEALRAKDEFLALLGHELRNPLAPIVTALGLIRRKGAAHLEDEISLIGRQVHHLSRLVDDLLDITRITRDRVDLERSVFELRQALLEAVEMVLPMLQQRRHSLQVDIGELTGSVDGDAHRLRQLFTNLLVNAGKYTPEGGEIRVHAHQAAGQASVTISDNGSGIEPELLPRVFDLFEQGKVSSDRAQGGLGIGLALVRKLAMLHEGSVTAHSDGAGKGASFTVRLPLCQPAAAPASAPAPDLAQSAAAKGQRVFLVDDNNDARETLSSLLGMFGYEVMAAAEAGEALRKAPDFQPDTVILDIGLPGMDGYQLAGAMRSSNGAKLRDARFIALTGYGQESDRARALTAGFHTHLVKPVQIDELLLALHRQT
jgi:signal transduction histidine kinase/ActR/RegA family two-component response regulator